MHENAELDVCAPVHLLIPVTQPRREACVFFSLGQTKGAYTHRRSTHLEDDSEYARKQDHEEQLVAKLGARLEVDSPIPPRVESQSDKIMHRSTEKTHGSKYATAQIIPTPVCLVACRRMTDA